MMAAHVSPLWFLFVYVLVWVFGFVELCQAKHVHSQQELIHYKFQSSVAVTMVTTDRQWGNNILADQSQTGFSRKRVLVETQSVLTKDEGT